MQGMLYEYLEQKYKKLTVLGNADKKTTWLAQDVETGQIVVKKYVSLENAGIYERLTGLCHKNLIRIIYTARGMQNAAVIMEYVSGQTLEDCIAQRGTFSREESIVYIRQMLEGLREVHKIGIVHRDINPRNLILSTDGIVKILDFDIGRLQKENQGRDTQILGTAGYAAPEQFGFMQSDARADLYAAGVLMNVLLTGKEPCLALSSDADVSAVIKKCIQLEPEKRYQSADELLQALEELQKPGDVLKTDTENVHKPSIWPGFRSGIRWKKITAGSYYIIMTVYTIGSIAECSANLTAAAVETAALLIYIWLSALLSFDFLQWMERVPVIRRFGRMGKRCLGAAVWLLLFVGGYELEQYVYIEMLHILPGRK